MNGDEMKQVFVNHYTSPLAFHVIPRDQKEKYNRILNVYEEFEFASLLNMMEILQVAFELYKTKHITKEALAEDESFDKEEVKLLKLYMDDSEDLGKSMRRFFTEQYEGFYE